MMRSEQIKKLADRFVVEEDEIRRMMKRGMSNQAIANVLQKRWEREEANVERLVVLMKRYSPEGLGKEQLKRMVGEALNARRAKQPNEWLRKLKKAKRAEAITVAAFEVPFLVLLTVIAFLFGGLVWGICASVLLGAWCLAAVFLPRFLFRENLKAFTNAVERMYRKEGVEVEGKVERT